jgi:hypothetical protein
MRLLGIAVALAGCSFPTRSEDFACSPDNECDEGRVCELGFCVVSEVDAAVVTPPIDAPPMQMPDADPFIAIAEACKAKGYVADATTGGLYRTALLQTDQINWTNAQASCKADVANATHLIVLSTAEELAFMRALTGADAWIGLSDIVAEAGNNGANFVTVTGETGDQRPFAGGEPNNGGGNNEDCVAMRGSDNNLDDKPCTGLNLRYVCECDGKPSNP